MATASRRLEQVWVTVLVLLALADVWTPQSTAAPPSPSPKAHARPKGREQALEALFVHLGLKEGATVADVGAGKGQDTWIFAKLVGAQGTVFSEEISEGLVKSLQEEAKKRSLSQVRVVLGRDDSPCLPPDCVDMAFMHYVYHHMSKPRPMLRGLWEALKPGGYLVVVDQRRGTLRDWGPREERQQKHFWTAETTVVREAREEGFAFVECAEAHWHANEPFVLVFQRPAGRQQPGGDPDPFLPLSPDAASAALVPLKGSYGRPVIVALGEGRKLLAPILGHSSGQALEIVLEEWATQKDERPPLPEHVAFPSVMTDMGRAELGADPIDVVFFLDSFHLLFHGKTLLDQLHQKLLPEGCVYVLDREASAPVPRRQASHLRRIHPETVKQEMAEAGFSLWFVGPRLAPDRFLLVFGKRAAREIAPEHDPFIAGPELPDEPGRWLAGAFWRLRGLRTADGKCVWFSDDDRASGVQVAPAGQAGAVQYRIAGKSYLLKYERIAEGHRVLRCEAIENQN